MWDYGLSMDLELLCVRRQGGSVPFKFMPDLWRILEERRVQLSLRRSGYAVVWREN